MDVVRREIRALGAHRYPGVGRPLRGDLEGRSEGPLGRVCRAPDRRRDERLPGDGAGRSEGACGSTGRPGRPKRVSPNATEKAVAHTAGSATVRAVTGIATVASRVIGLLRVMLFPCSRKVGSGHRRVSGDGRIAPSGIRCPCASPYPAPASAAASSVRCCRMRPPGRVREPRGVRCGRPGAQCAWSASP